MEKKQIIFIMAMFLNVPLAAQETTTAERVVAHQNISAWTMEQCIDYAVTHAVEVRRGEVEVKKRKGDYRYAVLDFLPSVSADDYNLLHQRNLARQTLMVLKSAMCFPVGDSLMVAVSPSSPLSTPSSDIVSNSPKVRNAFHFRPAHGK